MTFDQPTNQQRAAEDATRDKVMAGVELGHDGVNKPYGEGKSGKLDQGDDDAGFHVFGALRLWILIVGGSLGTAWWVVTGQTPAGMMYLLGALAIVHFTLFRRH